MSVDLFANHYLQLEDEARQERLDAIQRATLAYDGEAPLPFDTPKAGEPDDNIRLNFNRVCVDKGVAFLFGKPIQWSLEGNENAEEDLRRFWRATGGGRFARKLAKSGAKGGHAFAKLMPANAPRHPLPRAIVLDPSNVEVFWDDEDIDKVERFEITWPTRDRETGKVVVRRQTIRPTETGEAWEIIDEVSEESGDNWTEIDTNIHEFPWPPIFDCQNLDADNEFYGTADLSPDVLDLVEALEKCASDMRRIVRLHGHPWPYVTGAPASAIEEVDASIDALTAIDGDNVDVGQLEMKAQLEAPIRLWRELKLALHELTRIPEISTRGVENVGQLSGLALQILYQSLIEKTDEKRDSYGGDLLVPLATCALELMGHGAELEPTIQWPEMLPDDPVSEAQALEADQRMEVVSRQTIAEKRGYDWEVERQRIEDEGGVPSQGLVPDVLAGVIPGASNRNGGGRDAGSQEGGDE